ncbi:MAG: glycoside hydrolase family 2 [Clostridia bacterium]|nr:glycoside hydrolase family 2 [Clostridia bacterium]
MLFPETLNSCEIPLPEYPRPQFVRDSYLCLNGYWDYIISSENTIPKEYEGKIKVPFSPESPLSGVNKKLGIAETLWYRKSFDLTEDFMRDRLIINFGAVDFFADVYVNASLVGCHAGGYTAFSFDITDFVHIGENEIIVAVRDESDTSYHSRGKQREKRGGIWYTSQSGIWQTVWLESVPERYISSLLIVPSIENSSVSITIRSDCDTNALIEFSGKSYTAKVNEPCEIHLDSFTAWTPETPQLYSFSVKLEKDRIESYFAMRSFSVEKDEKGVMRLFLNGKPYFHNGLLDQGYFGDGMYTPESDEMMISDIVRTKEMGFNMLRKHIKIEPMRWYYHCDRLGVLVWQDMLNGGRHYNPLVISTPLITKIHFKDSHYSWFARSDRAGRDEYYRELEEMVTQLINVPSIAMWVLFNEGWGQFDAEKAYEKLLTLDKTRTVDHASGWHDQGIGDIQSLHVYFMKYKFIPDKLGRAVILSEFGGYNYRIEGHSYSKRNFGYKHLKSAKELKNSLESLYRDEIFPAIDEGLAAAVYTQLSDVEDEVNGLITHDRAETKLPTEEIRKIVEYKNS